MGNLLKGLAEMLANNGSIIDAIANPQSVLANNIFKMPSYVAEDDKPFGLKKGSSHIFSEKGDFIRAEMIEYQPSETNRGTNVYIEIKKDQNKKEQLLLTDYPMPEQETLDGLAKIFQFYAGQVQIEVGDSSNKVGIMKPKSTSPNGSVMFTTGTNIYATVKDGKLLSILSDYYNIQNSLLHEAGHRFNAVKGVKDGEGQESFEHAKVYQKHINHPTFKKTTIEFQKGILTNLAQTYLTNSILVGGLQYETVDKLVSEINTTLKSYKKELGFYFSIYFKSSPNPPYSPVSEILQLK